MFFSLPLLYEFDHNYYANYFSLEKVRGYWVFANLGGVWGVDRIFGLVLEVWRDSIEDNDGHSDSIKMTQRLAARVGNAKMGG